LRASDSGSEPIVGRTAASWKAVFLIAYAKERGMPPEETMARFGLDPAAVADIDGRVPIHAIARMWNELPALLGDPDMPLNVLAAAARADPPLSVLIFLSSPTFGDALRRMVRYERLGYDLADKPTSDLLHEGDRVHLVQHPEQSPIAPPTGAVVQAAAAILMLARRATQREIAPLAAMFRHPRPKNIEPYRAVFAGPLTFDANEDRVTFAAADLLLPHPEASRTLLTIAERHADDTLAQLPSRDDFLTAVRRAIRARLPDGNIGLSDVAEPLGVSARTLQRRLNAEGTSLRRLVDEVRQSLALHHIQNKRTSLVEIAFLVGFADQSAFTRAFARWTSRSPTEYRRSLS
jgi:AraC-like DNA-binding protein